MSQSTSLVQELREITGAGVMECKKALEETGGDLEKAKALIYERGLSKVEKRAGRATGAGLLYSYIHNGRIGVLLEVRAETDFVVRSEPFQAMVKELAMQLAAVDAENVDAFLAQPYIRDDSKTVDSLVKEVIAKVGENVQISRFARFEV